MEWTDRHFRYLMRFITKRAILYSEMVTVDSILHGNRERILRREDDSPVVLQLAGSNPNQFRKAVSLAREFRYDAYNFNAGCPSEKVTEGKLGACLMAEPERVADCILAIQDSCKCPVSVKHRIGISGREEYKHLSQFVRIVYERSGCRHFIVHARIAVLNGMSPRENRTIPPLRYEDVILLKREFPFLRIEINGGIQNRSQAIEMLSRGLDGVMIGRAAYENPMLFQSVDESFPEDSLQTQKRESDPYSFWENRLTEITEYLNQVVSEGGKVGQVLRHTMGFFYGFQGGRKYRQFLSERMHREPTNVHLFREALSYAKDLAFLKVSI